MEAKSIGMLLGGLGAIVGLSYVGSRSRRFAESSESDPMFYRNRARQIGKDIDDAVKPLILKERPLFEKHSPFVLSQYEDGEIDACEAFKAGTLAFFKQATKDGVSPEALEKAGDLFKELEEAVDPLVQKYKGDFLANGPGYLDAYEEGTSDGCIALHGLMYDLDDLQMLL